MGGGGRQKKHKKTKTKRNKTKQKKDEGVGGGRRKIRNQKIGRWEQGEGSERIQAARRSDEGWEGSMDNTLQWVDEPQRKRRKRRWSKGAGG